MRPAGVVVIYSSQEPRARRILKPVIYFIQAGEGGPTKVGWARKGAHSRLKELSCGNHDELRIVGFVYAPIRKDEYDFHSILSPWHRRGEWFDLPEAVLARIRAYSAPSTTLPWVPRLRS
jgi:hypothetical protein